MSKTIELTKGKVAIVDNEDYEKVNKFKWYYCIKGKKATTGYAVRDFRGNEDVIAKFGSRHIPLHRFLLNPTKNEFVDHINHNGLDNRKENLRVCNKSQNQANISKRKNSSNKYKGIEKQRLASSWFARITKDKKKIYLGSFKTEREAAIAYNEAAIKYYGEFANLNKI